MQYFITILLLVSTTFVGLTQDNWEFKKEVEGIRVYFRENPTSAIKDLKIDFEVEASLSTIVAVMNDVSSYHEWAYSLKQARMIEQVSDHKMIYYVEYDFPWPLYNRDMIIQGSWKQDPETKIITTNSESKHELEPENKGLVRLKEVGTQWTIIPVGHKKVRIKYTLSSDPGGVIPAWMVNLALDRGPTQTMLDFRKMLKKPRYANLNNPNVLEPMASE